MTPQSASPQGQGQSQGQVAYELPSGQPSRLIHRMPELRVRLAIDPAAATSADDTFTLTSDDGSFKKVLTVRDDAVPGDEFTDLIFANLKTTLKYTLEVNPGKEGAPYKVFENVPFQELVEYYSLLEPDDELVEKGKAAQQGQDTDFDNLESGSAYGGDLEDVEVTFDKNEADPDPDFQQWLEQDPEQGGL
jgi:hypothetical protein